MKQLIIAIIILIYSSVIFATETTGTIERIYINNSGLVLFTLSTTASGRPSCATNSTWDFKIDLNNSFSKEMLSMLLISQSTDKAIKAGSGANPSCGTGFPAIEVNYVYFAN